MTDRTPGSATGDGNEPLVLHVRPDTEEWGSEDDDRWREDLGELQRLLSRELPDETVAPAPAEGSRGAYEVSEVILALGSAGVMTAAVDVIKTWVGARPGRRKVKVSLAEGGVEQRTVVVDADGLGATELHDLAAQAWAGAPGRPAAGTAPGG
jgi:hypothetical protein